MHALEQRVATQRQHHQCVLLEKETSAGKSNIVKRNRQPRTDMRCWCCCCCRLHAHSFANLYANRFARFAIRVPHDGSIAAMKTMCRCRAQSMVVTVSNPSAPMPKCTAQHTQQQKNIRMNNAYDENSRHLHTFRYATLDCDYAREYHRVRSEKRAGVRFVRE